MASLTGSNRYYLLRGLKEIHKTNCLGLKALIKLCGLSKSEIRAEDIGFKIAPRINAVGRIGDPDMILKLLIETDEEQANSLAEQCNEINEQRKQMTSIIEYEAISLIESDKDVLPPFILIAQPHWHTGIVGIVASKIVEQFNRPVALLASNNDGSFRASVRAPKGFIVNLALDKCSDLLISHGGHAAAGGFTISAQNISKLHNKLNLIAQDWLLNAADYISISPEAHLDLSQINLEFWRQYSKLEPFGIGNPRPLFWVRGCHVVTKRILKGLYLKLSIEKDNFRINAIMWRHNHKTIIPEYIDITYHITLNKWNSKQNLELEITSIRPYSDIVIINKSNRQYKCAIKNHNEGIIIRQISNQK